MSRAVRFAAEQAFERYERAHQMASVQELAELNGRASVLVHELPKERSDTRLNRQQA